MMGTDAPPLRMIGYCRVSTDEQAMSGLGLADQEKRIREMAKPHGWRIVQMIRDEGLSAGTLERAGLYRALGQLAAGRADGLVVAKLDRLTRSTVDFGLLLEWFKDAGKTLVAARPRRRHQHRRRRARRQRHRLRRPVGARRDRRAHPRRARAAPRAGQAHRPARGRRRPGARHADQGHARGRGSRCGRSPTRSTPRASRRCAAPKKWAPSAIQSALGYKRPRKPRGSPSSRRTALMLTQLERQLLRYEGMPARDVARAIGCSVDQVLAGWDALKRRGVMRGGPRTRARRRNSFPSRVRPDDARQPRPGRAANPEIGWTPETEGELVTGRLGTAHGRERGSTRRRPPRRGRRRPIHM
jgi:DNA invertase Pin-like site-specific DNA recombinase